jgi:hypothetical protein
MIDHVSSGSCLPSTPLPRPGSRLSRSVRAVSQCAALACVLFAVSAVAQKVPVIVSQARALGTTGGGVISGTSPAGTTVGLTTTGNIILGNTYGNSIVSINVTTGTSTTLGTYSGAQAVAVDSANNIYISSYGTSAIVKVPYLTNGTYPTISTYASGTTPACTGTDTQECALKALTSTYIYGYQALAFDPSGNFYFVTAYNPYYSGANPSSGTIFKCSATCFANANQGVTGNAAAVFQETQPTSGNPLIVGGLAIDTLGNIFFTDSITSTSVNSSSSNLKELAVASGATGYASTATTLYTFTDATPAGYDDELDAVAVGANNTVYFATQFTGTFAMPNNNGVVDTANVYAVSPQGSKVMISDRNGSFYGVDYSNSAGADAGYSVYVGLVSATTAAVGATSMTTGVSAVLNSGVTCANAPTTTVTSTTTEFSATAGTCGTTGLISTPVIPLTVSFAPTTPGTRTAILTATSGATTGTATVTGVATGGTVPTPTFTPAAGTYPSAQSVTISDAAIGSTIYYTVGSSPPTTSSTVYSGPISVTASETINAIAAYPGSTTSAVVSSAYVIQALTAQTITFNPPASPVQYGVGPITLSASSTSGLAVTFGVSGPATISGNQLTITGAGVVTVTASQAGNGTYAAATPVQQTIVVNGGSVQAIIFKPLANYNHTTTPTIPLVAYATSGLALTYTATGPATVNGNNTLTITAAGNVTVTASQAGNGNYAAASPVSRTFTAQ